MNTRPLWLSGLLYLAAALLVLLAIGPALYLVLIALQPAGTDMRSFSRGLTLANFAAAWEQGNLARPMLSSVIVTAARAALNVVICALAAYPLARMEFRGRSTALVVILATMMIPEQVIVVPMFKTVVAMGLYDSLLGVIIPFSVSAFGIFLCRQAFLAIPPSLEEAARIDGASAFAIWRKVMLPLSTPTLATLAIFTIIGAWSDLLWPLIVLQSRESATLPVAINELMGEFATNQRLAYAASVLAIIPVITVFVLAQRWLRPELLAGGVKG